MKPSAPKDRITIRCFSLAAAKYYLIEARMINGASSARVAVDLPRVNIASIQPRARHAIFISTASPRRSSHLPLKFLNTSSWRC